MSSTSSNLPSHTDREPTPRRRAADRANATVDSRTDTPDRMLDYLQRTAGNRAVNILLQRSTPQQMMGGLRGLRQLQRDDDAATSTDAQATPQPGGIITYF
jgi:hypothetical protein